MSNKITVNRRQFAASLAPLPFALSAAAAPQQKAPWDQPAEVAKAYLIGPKVHWPKPDLDVAGDVREIDARLAEVEKKHPNSVRFTGGEILRSSADIESFAAKHGETDGLLIIPLGVPMPSTTALLKAVKRPALYFSLPYAGHGWASIAGLRKQGHTVAALATSSYGDLDPYMEIFKAVHHLRNSKLLVATDRPEGRTELTDAFTKRFGVAVKYFTLDDMYDVLRSGDESEAARLSKELKANALRVVEPSDKEINDAMRFYLGIQALMEKEQANAITIDCFSALMANKLAAYPCISWSKLNDQGKFGVCEADVNSTLTQMLVTPCTGKPGFVSDPVFDVSRNEVIHAHCVAATKMQGINGPSSPYLIRNHLETAEGATLQVLMPSDETITALRFVGSDRMLLSAARVTGHITTDRGCRSQIRTVVSDAQKWLDSYQAGLHRVIFYGDHVRTVERMGQMMGFDVVHEI